MRRLTSRQVLAGCVLILLASAPACKRREVIQTQKTDEGRAAMASVVHMADPSVAVQLVRGFYPVEGNAWRWTAGKFAVNLRSPGTAAQNGAVLQFKFAIPDAVMSRVQSTTLTASVNGIRLQPATYTKSGEYTYTQDVSPSAFSADSVLCEFAFDKFLPPGSADQRELAVVASSVGLQPR